MMDKGFLTLLLFSLLFLSSFSFAISPLINATFWFSSEIGYGNQLDFPYTFEIDSNNYLYGAGVDDAVGQGEWCILKMNSSLQPEANISFDWSDDHEAIYASAMDSNDNLYVAGYAYVSATDTTWRIMKLNSSLQPEANVSFNWSAGDDTPFSAAVDSSNNIYIVGSEYLAGASDWGGHILKLDSSLNHLANVSYNWSPSVDSPRSIAIDSDDNIYVGGLEYHAPYTLSRILKLNASLETEAELLLNFSGISRTIIIGALRTDSAGNLYAACYDRSGSDYNWSIFKFDSSLNQLANVSFNWSEGSEWMLWDGMEIDSMDNIYIAGCNNCSGVNASWRILKLNSDLEHVQNLSFDWTSVLDEPRALAIDSYGNIYAGGVEYFADVGGQWRVLKLERDSGGILYTGDTAECTRGFGPYSTIQSAVNASPSSDTIAVCAGNYSENIVINGSIILYGSQLSGIIINASNSSLPVLHLNYTHFANISNLTVEGANSSGGSGIYIYNSNNSNLYNITSLNNEYGFLIEQSSNNTLINNTATNNTYQYYFNNSNATLIANYAYQTPFSGLDIYAFNSSGITTKIGSTYYPFTTSYLTLYFDQAINVSLKTMNYTDANVSLTKPCANFTSYPYCFPITSSYNTLNITNNSNTANISTLGILYDAIAASNYFTSNLILAKYNSTGWYPYTTSVSEGAAYTTGLSSFSYLGVIRFGSPIPISSSTSQKPKYLILTEGFVCPDNQLKINITSSGMPVEGATVILMQMNPWAGTIGTRETDSNGTVVFTIAANGTYKIIIYKSGYISNSLVGLELGICVEDQILVDKEEEQVDEEQAGEGQVKPDEPEGITQGQWEGQQESADELDEQQDQAQSSEEPTELFHSSAGEEPLDVGILMLGILVVFATLILIYYLTKKRNN